MLSIHHGCFTLFQYLFIYLSSPGISCSTQDFQSSWQHVRPLSSSMQTLSCSMWNLVPRPEMDPGSPALGARSLCHWTTREVPHIVSRWCGLRKERPLLEHKAHAACHDVSSLSLTQESDVFCRHVPKCDWVNMLHCKQGGKISDFSQFWTLQPLTL